MSRTILSDARSRSRIFQPLQTSMCDNLCLRTRLSPVSLNAVPSVTEGHAVVI